MSLTLEALFTQSGRTLANATRSAARIMSGAVCPESIEIGFVHGSAPAVASMTFDVTVYPALAQQKTLQIGNASFFGVCISWTKSVNMNSGITTQVVLEDMRTRLHDKYVYMQINMLDSEGRWFHLFPDDWETQIKTFVSELNKEKIKIPPKDVELAKGLCGGTAISTKSIIKYLAATFNFSFSADDKADDMLETTFPDNVDHNNGSKVIDVLQQLLSRFGLQMTFWGNLHCHITLKGYTESVFVNQLARGGATAICSLPNSEDGSIGVEINDRGRKCTIIGGRNKYQAMYAAIPDWNPKWSLSMAISGELGAATIMGLGLTELDKLEDMPAEWQDDTKINNVKRNEMTIKDYLNTIVGRVYRLNFAAETDKFGNFVTGIDLGLNCYTNTTKEDCVNSEYPVSESLVEDSERNFFSWGTFRDHNTKQQYPPIILGKWPVEDERVILADGSIESQETYNPLTCRCEYIVRISYNEVRYTRLGDIKPDEPGLGLVVERPAVCIATDREFFIYKKNPNDNAVRSREIKKNVSYLRKGFIMEINEEEGGYEFTEKPMLQNNFVALANTITADEIAPIIADQTVVEEVTKTAGHINFDNTAGFRPDGIIDSVKVSVNSQINIKETVNFTTSYLDFDSLPVITEFKPLQKFENEKDVADRELRMRGRAMILAEKAKNAIRGLLTRIYGDKTIEGQDRVGMSNSVGDNGYVKVEVPATEWRSEDTVAGDVKIIS